MIYPHTLAVMNRSVDEWISARNHIFRVWILETQRMIAPKDLGRKPIFSVHQHTITRACLDCRSSMYELTANE